MSEMMICKGREFEECNSCPLKEPHKCSLNEKFFENCEDCVPVPKVSGEDKPTTQEELTRLIYYIQGNKEIIVNSEEYDNAPVKRSEEDIRKAILLWHTTELSAQEERLKGDHRKECEKCKNRVK
jgi:hypothetical protein